MEQKQEGKVVIGRSGRKIKHTKKVEVDMNMGRAVYK